MTKRCTFSEGGGRHYCADALDRFWAKVNKTDSCWLWTAKIGVGYGLFVPHKGLPASVAHRYAYEFLIGPIEAGLQLDHLCRVRNCVNPAHLEPVTPAENVRRTVSPPSANMAKTHCPRGHEYDMELSGNRRWCRTCDRAQKLERQRQPAAVAYRCQYEAAYRERRRELRQLRKDRAA